MDSDYKVSYHFLATKMILVKHLSNVTEDQVVFLYIIVTEKSIDIGQLIFNNIVMSAQSPRDELCYPSLFSTLCHQAGVVWSTNEELLYLKIPLDGGIINRLKRHLDHQVDYLKAIEEMMRAYVEHVSMDMAIFPTLPIDHT
ncbi:Uncharacterized protein TCM_039903 [Theobroma cacao]|uniref:Putative plant transposon protein domain-containing protein n=1 Tax=Theobroma cacao TaxID=3641 RepID=A0A061GR01_THECC|nr:Uncharacterized protein TCM_039903 [Theobroma cacao]